MNGNGAVALHTQPQAAQTAQLVAPDSDQTTPGPTADPSLTEPLNAGEQSRAPPHLRFL